jgi:hypothetical protein
MHSRREYHLTTSEYEIVRYSSLQYLLVLPRKKAPSSIVVEPNLFIPYMIPVPTLKKFRSGSIAGPDQDHTRHTIFQIYFFGKILPFKCWKQLLSLEIRHLIVRLFDFFRFCHSTLFRLRIRIRNSCGE